MQFDTADAPILPRRLANCRKPICERARSGKHHQTIALTQMALRVATMPSSVAAYDRNFTPISESFLISQMSRQLHDIDFLANIHKFRLLASEQIEYCGFSINDKGFAVTTGKRSMAAHIPNDWKQYNIVDTITPSICTAYRYLQVSSCAPRSQCTQYVHNCFAAQRLKLSPSRGTLGFDGKAKELQYCQKVDNILPTIPNLLPALHCTPTVLQLFG